MAPTKKKISDMSAEEINRLTSDDVIERVFDKKVLRELKKEAREAEARRSGKKKS
ncbi:MAG TPA: hypothetical protein VLU25_09845 [Acidobacteriota bacterium]|nr:hypothetical protein [Acidobacteriota bacterium]